ncbi:POTRA domain-containing protein [Nonlabens sp.]|uniref:POTRA domain-containing protein n=1 Tax=Nonlabens sp. TaxID=1888209 RepID=UPI003F6A4087
MSKSLLLIMVLFITNSLLAQNIIIKNIQFEGLKRTKESFLRRLVKVKPLSAYNIEQIETDVERLNRLPGIAKAVYQLDKTNPAAYILTYEVVENFTIIPGVRVSQANDDSFAFRLSVFEFNFLGQNQIIGGFYGRNVFDSFGGYWEAPYLFSNKLGIGVNYIKNVTREPIFFPDDNTVNYKLDNLSTEIYALYELDFHNNFQLGIKYVDQEYSFIDGLATTDVPDKLSAQKWSILTEYENNHLVVDYQYVYGYRNFTNVELITGGEGLLDDELIAQTDFQYFKKIGNKGNWASRLKLSYATFNDSRFAPFALDNQLNIRGAGNSAGRGTAEITLNTEYRHTLYEKDWFVLQSNTFLDTGTRRNPTGDLNDLVSNSTLKVNPGLGIRFIHKRIFNAVIRFDYGFGIGNNATNGFVFGIGQYF